MVLINYQLDSYCKKDFYLIYYNVGSASDMVFLPLSDAFLTSNAKEDNKKILILEAKLWEYSRKISDMERQLKWEREDKQRALDETKTEMETLKTEASKATIAVQLMEQKYLMEINDIKKQLALFVKERQEQKRELEETKLKMNKQAEVTVAMQQKYEEYVENLKERLTEAEERHFGEIKSLHDQLKEQERIHIQKDTELKKEKHALEIRMQKMNANEERLKRELSEVKLKATRLKHELRTDHKEHGREMEILRKQSRKVMKEKEANMRMMDAEIQELRWLLSQTYGESTSLMDSGAHSKRNE